MSTTAHDLPFRSRLVACDLCGRLGLRADIKPTLVLVDGRYSAVERCTDRRACDEARRASLTVAVAGR